MKKDMDIERVVHCGGFKNCHESVRTYDEQAEECQECIEDVADAHEQMDKYFEEMNNG